MQIIPAIDIIDGKCVRLEQGNFDLKKVYKGSPLETAKEFEANGIKYLHLVDLDGAKSGSIQNAKVLDEIASNTNLKIDFGGGIKSDKDIQLAFDSGAQQITAGSIAIKKPEMVKDWINKYGADKIILGADVSNEQVVINGWQTDTGINIINFVEDFLSSGINRMISTDIAVDGMLAGPSLSLYKKLMAAFPQMEIVASGGVSSEKDLKNLKENGLSGVIIGKAIYENKISLKELSAYVS